MSRSNWKPRYDEWLERHEKYLETMSLHALVEEALSEAPGDDYDGCFSTYGAAEFALTKQKLALVLMSLEEGPFFIEE